MERTNIVQRILPTRKKKPLSRREKFCYVRAQAFRLVQSIAFMLVGQFQLSVNEKELRCHLAGRDPV